MDLKERNLLTTQRHPWETSRLKALQKIVGPELHEGMRVLDVGCGDGFIARGLFAQLRNKHITAVDTQLSDQLIDELAHATQDITYQKTLPRDGAYELILLLDVLEHIASDHDFLADVVANHCAEKGKVMITVPAFQSLYGSHDSYLGHYRRYRLKGLELLATSCGLQVLSSGYLFSSLLLPKLVLFKLCKTGKSSDGVGNWHGSKYLTGFIENILNMDNSILLSANRLGIRLPGLTGWALCEKRES